jgi:uncharacterized membrane protein
MQADPIWVRALLGVHIAAGVTSFIMAPIAMATAKGGRAHRRWGAVYFWAMAVVASTAVVLSIYRPILFLALVAIFSFYAAFLAYRVLKQKGAVRKDGSAIAGPLEASRVSGITPLDWGAGGLTFFASLALFLCGWLRPAWIQNLPIPAMVFGVIGMRLAGTEMWRFTHPPTEKMFWWFRHLQGMLASYIAAWTAFLVVALGRFVHAWWLWILPTAIGVPAIAMVTIYYQRKFAGKGRKSGAPIPA